MRLTIYVCLCVRVCLFHTNTSIRIKESRGCKCHEKSEKSEEKERRRFEWTSNFRDVCVRLDKMPTRITSHRWPYDRQKMEQANTEMGTTKTFISITLVVSHVDPAGKNESMIALQIIRTKNHSWFFRIMRMIYPNRYQLRFNIIEANYLSESLIYFHVFLLFVYDPI